MNILADELAKRFEEVGPMEFYREIFPVGELDRDGCMTKGKYTGVALEITRRRRPNGKQVVRRYTVTDELDGIRRLLSSEDFCVLAPVSYVGKDRKSENARVMYALVVEVDNLVVRRGVQAGLRDLVYQWGDKSHRLPKPTFTVASGTGLHLYYVFERGIPLFPAVVKSIQLYKRELTVMVWNGYVTDSYKEIQQESIFQAFRMVGTVTKGGDQVRAFRTGERVTIGYMNGFMAKYERSDQEHCVITEVYKSNLTLAQAKKKYPEWYDRRILRGEPKGHWVCKRDLYDWWKRKITREATVGHRYYCLMMLAVYAIKCDIQREELEADCMELMDVFEGLTDSEVNHFTEKDVLDALQSFEDKGLVTYPVTSIANRSGIVIPKNKRNHRKQVTHLKIARATLEIMNDELGRSLQGRPTAELDVRIWRIEHPEGRKADCIRDTGLSKPTVYKWWRMIDWEGRMKELQR